MILLQNQSTYARCAQCCLIFLALACSSMRAPQEQNQATERALIESDAFNTFKALRHTCTQEIYATLLEAEPLHNARRELHYQFDAIFMWAFEINKEKEYAPLKKALDQDIVEISNLIQSSKNESLLDSLEKFKIAIDIFYNAIELINFNLNEDTDLCK